MGLPEGSFAIAAFIVLALPGFIFSGIRRWLRGESVSDRSVSLTVARGAIFAIALSAVYLAIWGPELFDGLAPGKGTDSFIVLDPRRVGLVVLVLYIVIPALISFALQFRHIQWGNPGWLERRLPEQAGKGQRPVKELSKPLAPVLRWFVRVPSSKYGYESTPSAWDHAIRTTSSSWVKVKRANGDWVGGWYTKGSLATTYPEPRSIYINEQWSMSETGDYEAPIPNTGFFLVVNDEDLVIWTRNDEAEEASSDGKR